MNSISDNIRLKNEHTGISNALGVFLDIIRFAAALLVLIVHARDLWFPEFHHENLKAADFSHLAVVTFFVLSGFVICYSVTANNRGPLAYVEARFSRIYSVLVPALIISAFIEWYLFVFDTSVYEVYSRGYPLVRYIASLFVSNELWLNSTAPPINSPLWSLSFEGWYYVLFGVALYVRKYRFITIGIVSLMIGPKILLLFPIWLMGFYAFKYKKNSNDSWTLTFFLIGMLILVFKYLPPLPNGIGYYPFYMAGQFVTDWILGSLIALVFLYFPNVNIRCISKNSVKKIRKMADLTLAIYLLHYPFLILFKSLYFKDTYMNLALSILFSFVLSAIVGIVLEHYRYVFNNIFKYIIVKYGVLVEQYHSIK